MMRRIDKNCNLHNKYYPGPNSFVCSRQTQMYTTHRKKSLWTMMNFRSAPRPPPPPPPPTPLPQSCGVTFHRVGESRRSFVRNYLGAGEISITALLLSPEMAVFQLKSQTNNYYLMANCVLVVFTCVLKQKTKTFFTSRAV